MFGQLPDLIEKPNQATSLQNFRNFFDVSTSHAIQAWENSLILIDTLYEEIVQLGFAPDVARARLKSLESPCAFNVFIKTNTILSHQKLKSVEAKLEDTFGPKLLQRIRQKHIGYVPQENLDTKLKDKLGKRVSEFFSYIETLRAFLSQHVFIFLSQILRDSNINDCRQPDMLVKRVSLCAVLGLMLEQVLDLVEQCRENMEGEQVIKAERLGRLLLGYLQPPSILASIPDSPVNQSFGKDANPGWLLLS
jgi:hypothetical protein